MGIKQRRPTNFQIDYFNYSVLVEHQIKLFY